MATSWSIPFDGTGTDRTAVQLGVTSKSGVWDFDTGDKVEGSSSVKSVVTTQAAMVKDHPADQSLHYYDICFKFTALPSVETMILQTRSTGTNKAQVMLNQNGRLRIRNGSTEVDASADGVVTANEWFRVKWGIGFSVSGVVKQELRVYTDVTPSNLFSTTPDVTLQGNYTGGTWNDIRIGILTSAADTIRVDRFIADDSTWPTSGGSGNQAPTADAGPDQDSVIGGHVVTLDGTGSSDPDGTIASYSWSRVSGATVTLSNPADDQPTFTAPTTAGSVTFALRVTDNDGAQSTADNVTITWSNAPTDVPTSDWYELLQGAAEGNPVTLANSDFDVLDTGFVYAAPIADGSGAMTIPGTGVIKIATHLLSGALNEVWADGIFQIDNLAAGPWYIMRAMSGSTLQATVRVNTDGKVQCRNGTTAVGTATVGTVAAGAPFRIAWHLNNTSTDQWARLYTGGNLYSDETGYSETTGNYDSGTIDRIGFGISAVAVASGNLVLSTLQVDESGWPDPYGAGVGVQQISEIYEMTDTQGWQPMNLDILG